MSRWSEDAPHGPHPFEGGALPGQVGPITHEEVDISDAIPITGRVVEINTRRTSKDKRETVYSVQFNTAMGPKELKFTGEMMDQILNEAHQR